ncbi:hypothetical protein [Streptomyces vinaceus]|uniref:hypothetical protein n=1 Tax=Streptomyces vinaceus TaxID=1960 RepID=UPI003674F435
MPTTEGSLYLASRLDPATREIIEHPMIDHHHADPVIGPRHGRLEPGCVIHSDRRSEYTSRQPLTSIGESRHRHSTGRTGSCLDNSTAESFLAVLKEETGTRFRPDRATTHADISDFTETLYSRRRLREPIHWGSLTPHETRLRHQQDQTPAA